MTASIFDANQIKAVELLAAGDMTYKEVAKAVGISVDTLYRWRRKEGFQQAVRDRCRELVKDLEPILYNAAIKKVIKDGSHHHIKILLDRIERLDEQLENNQEDSKISFTWKKTGDRDDIQITPNY